MTMVFRINYAWSNGHVWSWSRELPVSSCWTESMTDLHRFVAAYHGMYGLSWAGDVAFARWALGPATRGGRQWGTQE